MATVNIVFANAGQASSAGGIAVYNGRFSAVETLTSTGTSQATTITATRHDIARIKVSGGSVYISAPDADPTAVDGEGWLVGDGDVLDIANLEVGDKLAVIDPA